jgi:hypothetical protein
MKTVIVMMMGALLVAAAPVKLAPADDKPSAPLGAAARHKHGPDPMAKPPEDVGSAEDEAPKPGQSYINQPKPPVEAAPANPK